MQEVFTNFSFQNATMSLAMIIWGLYAGILIGGGLSVYHKWYLGAAVRGLLGKECFTPETAQTLSALGLNRRGLRRALREGSTLRKCIFIANPEECTRTPAPGGKFRQAVRKFFTGDKNPKPRLNGATALLYVPEEKKYHAAVRYEKAGSSPLVLVIAAVVFLALAILATRFIPQLLHMTDAMITGFRETFG